MTDQTNYRDDLPDEDCPEYCEDCDDTDCISHPDSRLEDWLIHN